MKLIKINTRMIDYLRKLFKRNNYILIRQLGVHAGV